MLERCTGSLDAAMLSCRLMVLDHHGTTLNLAFAANTPLVLYWDPRAWELCPEAEALLELLHGAGIWHPTPEDAAAGVARIWPDARGWWQAARVQSVRLRWCERFALSAGAGFDVQWMRALRTL
jgi:putative transferase (TIGR04331 family)